jgi:hypothetical protein
MEDSQNQNQMKRCHNDLTSSEELAHDGLRKAKKTRKKESKMEPIVLLASPVNLDYKGNLDGKGWDDTGQVMMFIVTILREHGYCIDPNWIGFCDPTEYDEDNGNKIEKCNVRRFNTNLEP